MHATTAGLATDCPSGGCPPPGNDLITPSQTFQSTITATAGSQNVWNDLSPAYAGLGVGLVEQGSDADQIFGGDILTITFNSAVQLTGIETLFAAGHDMFGSFNSTQILGDGPGGVVDHRFLLNGVSTTFWEVNAGLVNLPSGTIFTFQQLTGNPSFYVSALTFIGGQSTTPVPIPGAVWLFGSALAGLGLLARRRRRERLA